MVEESQSSYEQFQAIQIEIIQFISTQSIQFLSIQSRVTGDNSIIHNANRNSRMNNKKGIFNFLISIKIHVYVSKASKKKAQPRGIPFLTKTPPTPCTNKKGRQFCIKGFRKK